MLNIPKLIQLPVTLWKNLHTKALILLYHRVANLDTDPQLLSITSEHFSEHLEFLSGHYNVISLSELHHALENGQIPDKSVIITFDDGYADNLLNAKPLLEKYNIPATFFVTSGSVGSKKEFWWDDLERILLIPDHLPDHLDLTINGKVWNWNLSNEKGNATGFEHGIQGKKWNVLMNSDPGPRYGLYRDLHRLLKPLPSDQQDAILTTLAGWSGLPKTGRITHRPLTLEELKHLDQGDLVEIGAHTVTHPMLSMQPYEIQKEEIFKGKQSLEQILNHSVQSFSYPFGGRGDFNNNTMNAVKAAGFQIACANYGSTLIKSADAYRLPRVLIRDWDIGIFSSKIKEWFYE